MNSLLHSFNITLVCSRLRRSHYWICPADAGIADM